jgi:hypothetical protein
MNAEEQTGEFMGVDLYGYNIGYHAIHLGESYFTHSDHQIFEHTNKNDAIVNQLRTIKDAIVSLNNDRKATQKIDYSKNWEKRDLIDKVREINPNLVSPNCYAWKEGEIDAFIDSLNNEAKLLTNDMNIKTMNITQLFQDRNKIVEILAKIIETYDEESKHYVRRQIQS